MIELLLSYTIDVLECESPFSQPFRLSKFLPRRVGNYAQVQAHMYEDCHACAVKNNVRGYKRKGDRARARERQRKRDRDTERHRERQRERKREGSEKDKNAHAAYFYPLLRMHTHT